ncbi:hypothetical protein [Streptomyces xiaopingdaonensis]|uniref:hypothetical protein n=1 Tax=Streptomyces xiaopingdaonensis TaxID=1565415 RepID=UPI00030A9557|nr:hypothetical protein [Streptomyces xiaopingdaonensis]
MPRPIPAQLAYGSATVVCTTLAMLWLTQTRSGTGTAVIAVVGLLLGLAVAVALPYVRAALASRAAARTAPTSGADIAQSGTGREPARTAAFSDGSDAADAPPVEKPADPVRGHLAHAHRVRHPEYSLRR